jgi:glycosyltransferase involved in cell wall biosynthesis
MNTDEKGKQIKPDLSMAEVAPLPPEDAIEELSDVAVRILVGAETFERQHFNPKLVRLKLGGIEQILHKTDFDLAKWAADTVYRERISVNRLELITKSLPYMLECRKWIRKLLSDYYNNKLNKVRVLFLRGDNSGCGYWRMKLPGEYLKDQENNLSVHISDVQVEFDKLIQYDVIVVQRIFDFEQYYTLQMLKEAGKKIIYEIDDDVFSIEGHNPAASIYNRFDSQLCIRHCLALADVVVVTSERLAHALDVPNKSFVYPNSLDWDMMFSMKSKDNTRERKRIFWSGSNTHNQDFVECISALVRIFEERDDVELMVMGSCPNIVRQSLSNYMDRVFYTPGMHTEAYFNYIRSEVDADVGIIPLQNTVFNHSKSVCKGLEFTVARLPIVTSNYAPYSDVYENGVSAMLCSNDEDWYKSITTLLENAEMREEMIRNARRMAAKKFNLRRNAEKLGDVISRLGSDLLTARNEQKNRSEASPVVVQAV